MMHISPSIKEEMLFTSMIRNKEASRSGEQYNILNFLKILLTFKMQCKNLSFRYAEIF